MMVIDEFLSRTESLPMTALAIGDDAMDTPLGAARTVTKLPAQDLARARAFYRNQLGLEPVEEREGGLRYVCGPTEFHLFSSSGAPSGASTQMGFEIEDLEAAMA